MKFKVFSRGVWVWTHILDCCRIFHACSVLMMTCAITECVSQTPVTFSDCTRSMKCTSTEDAFITAAQMICMRHIAVVRHPFLLCQCPVFQHTHLLATKYAHTFYLQGMQDSRGFSAGNSQLRFTGAAVHSRSTSDAHHLQSFNQPYSLASALPHLWTLPSGGKPQQQRLQQQQQQHGLGTNKAFPMNPRPPPPPSQPSPLQLQWIQQQSGVKPPQETPVSKDSQILPQEGDVLGRRLSIEASAQQQLARGLLTMTGSAFLPSTAAAQIISASIILPAVKPQQLETALPVLDTSSAVTSLAQSASQGDIAGKGLVGAISPPISQQEGSHLAANAAAFVPRLPQPVAPVAAPAVQPATPRPRISAPFPDPSHQKGSFSNRPMYSRQQPASSSPVVLNRMIMSAQNTSDLLSVVRDHGSSFDFFNISSAIARVPKLVGHDPQQQQQQTHFQQHGFSNQDTGSHDHLSSNNSSGHSASVDHSPVSSPHLDAPGRALVARLAVLMAGRIDSFDARGLANSAWAFGKVRDGTLAPMIAKEVLSRLSKGIPGPVPSAPGVAPFMRNNTAVESLHDLDQGKARQRGASVGGMVAGPAVGFAHAGIGERGGVTGGGGASGGGLCAGGFSPQNLANLAWAFVYMGHRDEPLLEAMANQVGDSSCIVSALSCFVGDSSCFVGVVFWVHLWSVVLHESD